MNDCVTGQVLSQKEQALRVAQFRQLMEARNAGGASPAQVPAQPAAPQAGFTVSNIFNKLFGK